MLRRPCRLARWKTWLSITFAASQPTTICDETCCNNHNRPANVSLKNLRCSNRIFGTSSLGTTALVEAETIRQGRITEFDVKAAFADFENVSGILKTLEKSKVLRLLIQRIEFNPSDALAIQFEEMLQAGEVSDATELVSLYNVTQPRMSQIRALSLLAPTSKKRS